MLRLAEVNEVVRDNRLYLNSTSLNQAMEVRRGKTVSGKPCMVEGSGLYELLLIDRCMFTSNRANQGFDAENTQEQVLEQNSQDSCRGVYEKLLYLKKVRLQL